MTVYDTIHPNLKGVQTLDMQLASGQIASKGAILRHTNGYLYCAWAENYSTGVLERRLYLSISTDDGLTWQTPQQLTSGHWDDEPCLAQIDTTSTDSEIAVVLNRANQWNTSSGGDQTPYASRFTLDTSGNVTSSVDALTGVHSDLSSLNLVCTSLKYFVTGLYNGSLYVYSNTVIPANPHRGFTDNAWAGTAVAAISGSADTPALHTKLRRIDQGDGNLIYALLITYRSELNGEAYTGRGNACYNLGVRFCSDDLATWSTIQVLTSYADTPQMDLTGYKSVMGADMVQLSDKSLALLFQEFYPPQAINTLTTPSHAGSYIKDALYHPTHDYVVFAVGLTGGVGNNPGLYVYNLATQTVTRLTASSTPPLWSTSLNRIALSPDGKYLAVATDGGVDVLDTTSATISAWSVQSFKTTTQLARESPGDLRASQVEWVGFADDTTLLWGYKQTSSLAGCWGGKLDLADLEAGVIDLLADTSVTYVTTGASVIIGSDKIVFNSNGRVLATSLATGESLFNLSMGATNAGAYDDVNDEYVWAFSSGGLAGIKRLSAGVSSFTVEATFYTTGEGTLNPSGAQRALALAGAGILFIHASSYGSNYAPAFYAFDSQAPLGIVHSTQTTLPVDTFAAFGPAHLKIGNTWILGIYNSSTLVAIPTALNGRLRWGILTYNPDTGLLEGLDYYDAANLIKLGESAYHTQNLSAEVGNNDQIVIYGRHTDWLHATRPFANFIGIIEPAAYRIQMRARILKHYSYPDWDKRIEMKARLRNTYTATLDIGCRIVFAQCIKIKARIVPRMTRTLSMKASIRNRKLISCPASFSIQRTGQVRKAVCTFRITGLQPVHHLQLGARIIKSLVVRVTGHFVIGLGDGVSPSLPTVSTTRIEQTISLLARISK